MLKFFVYIELFLIIKTYIASAAFSRNVTWSEWSNWGPCSFDCGFGEQFRERDCEESVGDFMIKSDTCIGDKKQRMECIHFDCWDTLDEDSEWQIIEETLDPVEEVISEWTAWSLWSDCSLTCGEGRRSRFRLCDEKSDSSRNRVEISSTPCIGEMFDSEVCIVNEECVTTSATSDKPERAEKLAKSALSKASVIGIILGSLGLFFLIAIMGTLIRRWHGRQPYRRKTSCGKRYINPFDGPVTAKKNDNMRYNFSGKTI